MKKEFNTNNSKKLIIGISILFCTVILIIGGTTAYFTQSGIGETGNIVTENINGTIGYSDNKDYMRNNLIPVIDTDVDDFAMKNSSNGYTDNNGICVYTEEYNACSLYEFTITNNANVTQELIVSMSPTLNQYGNLYFIVYEGNRTSLTSNSKIVHYSTHIEQQTINFSDLNLKLEPSGSKTYTIVFYIKSLNIDQTSVDSGKTYAAAINVNSVTTGDYLSISVGEGCYDIPVDAGLGDGTFMLTKFNGIEEDGDVLEGCGVTKEGEYYSVVIPSEYAGKKISTLGNNLFMAAILGNDGNVSSTNIYTKIKSIEVNEGIQYLEDGLASGTFAAIGMGITDENYDLNIKLPNSLKNIGAMSFGMSALKEINLPNNLELIGSMSFIRSNLNSITIPASVTTIGSSVFYSNENLTSLTFEDTTDNPSQLTIIGNSAFEECNITSLQIPYSVTSIGDNAFSWNENLTRVIFEDTEENPSKLESIGEHAFYHDGLLYETEDDPLYMPASVTSIGDYAFDGNPDWTGKIYFIRYKGSQSNLDALGTSWYTHRYTVDVKAIG